MSYLLPDDPKLLSDINKRKEFLQYYIPKRPNVEEIRRSLKFLLDRLKDEAIHLELNSYQAMVSRLMDPNTPYARILLQWEPGMGKTLGAINIAIPYIRIFDKELEMDPDSQAIGNVTIISFTEEIFKRELLSYPHYGYINRQELKQWQELKATASAGTIEMDKLQEFTIRLKKRLTSRKNGGHFRFYGYKAFVNRIFMLQEGKRDINEMNEDEIRQALKDGSLKWNKGLLDSFKNSLLICDEIHDIYNSAEKNNWGIAIQMVLDYTPSLKAVFMSATPLNNSPTEIVDLCNLLNAPGKRIKRSDLFTDGELLPDALTRIGELVRGKISFVQDSNPEQFATQKMIGEEIEGIPYLKFHRVPMSPFHYNTYKQVYVGTLSQDAQYLVDMVMPNPDNPALGLYKTQDIKKGLGFVDEKWVAKNGFQFKENIIVGPGFDKDRIGYYSAKYAEMLRVITSLLTPQAGKIFVYHHIVHISGVLFIEQVLQANGYIGVDQIETEDTLCAVCGTTKKSHKVSGGSKIDSPILVNEKNSAAAAAFLAHTPLPNTFVIYDSKIGAIIAAVEYSTAGVLVNILVAEPYRRKGIGKYLLQSTVRKSATTAANIDDTAAIAFLQACGFEIAGEDLTEKFLIYGGNTPEIRIVRLKSALPILETDGARTWVAYDGSKLAGWIEYVDVENKLHLVNIQVLPEYRRKGIGRQLVQTTMPVESPVEISGIPEISKAFFEAVGFTSTDGIVYECHIKTSGGARSSKPGAPGLEHKFMPARYVMAHSDLDKAVMARNIDKLNAPDNTDGYLYKIIVGSKIIKQSYNFKAIRWQLIMSRPDNISILIQIFGRARRRDAHKLLPPGQRNITVLLITSCLPVKKNRVYELSHEETRYREKIADYITIQKIEKVMHENAIDGAIIRPIVEPGLDPEDNNLGALWYEPQESLLSSGLSHSKMDSSTFDIFHNDDEINMLVYVIKRLFIEQSLVFRYAELWEAVQHPPFPMQQNPKLFNEQSFIIALDMLLYKDIDTKYTQPRTTDISDTPLYLLDILHSSLDKRIIMPNRAVGYIHYIDGIYIFIPMRGITHVLTAESPFRMPSVSRTKAINVLRYIKESTTSSNYDQRKLKFKLKYQKVPLEKLSTAIGKFGVQFHAQFVEEIIKYVFEIWTNPLAVKSEHHDFYYKMLYFYDLMRLIIWGYNLKAGVKAMYKDYMLETKSKVLPDKTLTAESSSSSSAESLRVSKTEFYNSLKLSNQILKERTDKPTKKKKDEPKLIIKADPYLLPVGHFMTNVPKFYLPERDWFENPEYIQRTQEYIENNIIVGYYEKSPTGLRIKFKIRNPIHMIKRFKDVRMIEKGSICSSNNKTYLSMLAQKLKINLSKNNVPNLCTAIEAQLIANELEERQNKTNVKWFLLVFGKLAQTNAMHNHPIQVRSSSG